MDFSVQKQNYNPEIALCKVPNDVFMAINKDGGTARGGGY